MKKRSNRKTRLRMGAPGGVFASATEMDSLVFASDVTDLPGLRMPEPEDRRRIVITSAASALLHVLVIGGIAVLGYIAQQAVEKVIPVTILNEPVQLPGARDPMPLPVPKLLTAPIASAAPLALQAVDLAALPAPLIEAQSLDIVEAALLDLAEIQPFDIRAAERVGPSQTARLTAADLAAPDAFDGLSQANATLYQEASALPKAIPVGDSSADLVITGISPDFLAEGSIGTDPDSIAAVTCLESVFVQRYLREIERRTYARWEPPLDASPDDLAQFRIALDESGSIAKLELLESTSPPFAGSAIAAYRDAAPFPPLNDDNRCLAEETFKITFRNPELP